MLNNKFVKQFIIIIFLYLGINSNIYGQEDTWIYMYDWGGNENNNFTSYYNKKSLDYKNNHILVWIKNVYNIESVYPSDGLFGKNKKVDYSITQEKIYCGGNKINTVTTVIYFVDGTYYLRENEKISMTVIPGTNLDKQYQYFCIK